LLLAIISYDRRIALAGRHWPRHFTLLLVIDVLPHTLVARAYVMLLAANTHAISHYVTPHIGITTLLVTLVISWLILRWLMSYWLLIMPHYATIVGHNTLAADTLPGYHCRWLLTSLLPLR